MDEGSAARSAMAGFIIGYGAGIVFAGVAAVLLVRLRNRYRSIAAVIGPWLSPLPVAVLVSGFAFLVLTLLGMLLGLAYHGVEGAAPAGGLGSPNMLFTSLTVIVGAMLTAPWLVLLRVYRPQIAVAAVAFIALFGWALPLLAGDRPIS